MAFYLQENLVFESLKVMDAIHCQVSVNNQGRHSDSAAEAPGL